MTMHSSKSKMSPFVRQAAEEVDALPFRGEGWTSTYPGHGEIYPARAGEANQGQYAVDFMVASRAAGDAIADYLWTHRERLGVRYVIWYRRIISRTNLPSRWRTYVNPVKSKRGTASGDHTNHPHASFFSNAKYHAPAGSTTPKPAAYALPRKPWTVYLDRLRVGQRDSDSVAILQSFLGLKVTGAFGQAELDAVKAAQVKLDGDQEHADGKLGPRQAAALFGPAVDVELEA